MKRLSVARLSGAGLLALGLSVVMAPEASADVTLISQTLVNQAGGFPYTISKRGSFRLTSNLLVKTNVSAILVNAPNVTINLSGFSIVGRNRCTYSDGPPATVTCNGKNTSIGINGAANVANGSIIGFGTGLTANLLNGNLTVRNVTLSNHGTYAIGINGLNLQLFDSTLSTNGRRGVDGQFSTGTYLVRDSLIEKNGDIGVYLSAGSAIGNNFYKNVGEGIRSNVGRGSSVESNYFEANGVGLTGNGFTGYTANVFTKNTVNVDGGVNLGQNLCDSAICP